MSSLRNAIPRRAHKERPQPSVSFSHTLLLFSPSVYITPLLQLLFFALGHRGKNSACLKSTKTMSSVQMPSTRSRTLYRFNFTVSSSFNFSFSPLFHFFLFNLIFLIAFIYFVSHRNLGKKLQIETRMSFTLRWFEQKPLMEFIDQSNDLLSFFFFSFCGWFARCCLA